MKGRHLPVLLVFAMAAMLADGHVSGARSAQGSDLEWQVRLETDEDNPISDHKIVVARAEHTTATGGLVQVKATCDDSHSVAFEFDSFSKAREPLDFEYGDGDDESLLAIIYRVDSGDQILAINSLANTRYVNVAKVEFTLVGPDYKPASLNQAEAEAEARQQGQDPKSVGSAFANMLLGGLQIAALSLVARGPQDIRMLLHGRLVRFQLPISGGLKDIVAIAPGDPDFMDFLGRCGIISQRR